MANPINLGTIVDQSTGISTAWGQGINDWVYGAYGVLGATFSAGAFRAALGASAPADIQAQTATAFTTAGTSTAYTLTPSPAITSMVAGQRFRVKFNATAGAAPTLAISGLAATALKLYDSTGTKQAASATSLVANMLTDVEYDGTDFVIIDQIPNATGLVAASTAETQAGSLSTKAITPAGLLGAVAFANHYNSGNQTITSGGALTLAHGLGREPVDVKYWLKCLTAEHGYSIGNKIPMADCFSNSAVDSKNLVFIADATNISIRFGAAANPMSSLNFTNGVGVDLTSANWALVIDAWA